MSFALVRRSGFRPVCKRSVLPLRAGQDWRLANGKPRSGNEAGPIHDLSDFHFAGKLPSVNKQLTL